jgi:hypothetical protein
MDTIVIVIAIANDEVSTESGSDRVATLPMIRVGRARPGRYSLSVLT